MNSNMLVYAVYVVVFLGTLVGEHFGLFPAGTEISALTLITGHAVGVSMSQNSVTTTATPDPATQAVNTPKNG